MIPSLVNVIGTLREDSPDDSVSPHTSDLPTEADVLPADVIETIGK
jgi:hypothetical protein